MKLSPRPPAEINPASIQLSGLTARKVLKLKRNEINRHISPISSRINSHEHLPKLGIPKSNSA